MASDRELINFSEDHELDYILKRYGKTANKENRDILKEFGKELKTRNGSTRTPLKHPEFYAFLENEKGWKKA